MAVEILFLTDYPVSGLYSATALLRSRGADAVIDYKERDFMQDNERYDLIFDVPSPS